MFYYISDHCHALAFSAIGLAVPSNLSGHRRLETQSGKVTIFACKLARGSASCGIANCLVFAGARRPPLD